MQKVTLIGTGLMGYPMAQNILKGGYTLSVFNRTKEKADGLAKMALLLQSQLKKQ